MAPMLALAHGVVDHTCWPLPASQTAIVPLRDATTSAPGLGQKCAEDAGKSMVRLDAAADVTRADGRVAEARHTSICAGRLPPWTARAAPSLLTTTVGLSTSRHRMTGDAERLA